MFSNDQIQLGRRTFFRTAIVATAGITVWSQAGFSSNPDDENINIVGPKKGYTPQIGTLVSMMTWMRDTILSPVQGMSQEELDFLFDEKANSIGSMLLHLAATEAYYQANTFEGRREYNESEMKRWGTAMELGAKARKTIKGNNLSYYLSNLQEVREKTLSEFRKRDDKWLTTVDQSFFARKPTNNYCKWFHVCEHESNHNGQIKWLKSRLPGTTAAGKD